MRGRRRAHSCDQGSPATNDVRLSGPLAMVASGTTRACRLLREKRLLVGDDLLLVLGCCLCHYRLLDEVSSEATCSRKASSATLDRPRSIYRTTIVSVTDGLESSSVSLFSLLFELRVEALRLADALNLHRDRVDRLLQLFEARLRRRQRGQLS